MANWLNDLQDGFTNLRRNIPNGADVGASMRAAQFGGQNATPADAVANASPVQQPPNVDPSTGGGGNGGGMSRMPSPVAAPTTQPASPTFSQSSVGGIYKAVAPDGSVTFTDRPGGSFVPNTARPSNSGNQYDAAGRRIIAPVEGQLGVNRAAGGDFAAGDLAGHSGAKFLYQPQQGQDGADAGTKAGFVPGSTAWLNENNKPIDPTSSPDAAAAFANNKNALSSLRRGDGPFNRTVYDPSNYRASQVPANGMGMGMNGINPIDLINAQSNAQHRSTEDAVNTAKFSADQRELAEGKANDILKQGMSDPSLADIPEDKRRSLVAARILPDLFDLDNGKGNYLNTQAGLAGQSELAKRFGSMIAPGQLKRFLGSGPGPQQFGAGDLPDMQVKAETEPFRNSAASVIGPGYVPGEDGSYKRVGPADTSPGSKHVYYSSARNNIFGSDNMLTGGAVDPLFGKDNAGLLRYGPLLNHLRNKKYGQPQQ